MFTIASYPPPPGRLAEFVFKGEMEMNKVIGLVTAMVIVLSMTAFAIANESPVIEKTDRFDVMDTETGLSMMSRDGELIIHVGDGTEIMFEDETDARELLEENQTLAELLDGRNLIVSYSITTRSLPPQATPEKIVILYEVAVTLPLEIVDGDAPN